MDARSGRSAIAGRPFFVVFVGFCCVGWGSRCFGLTLGVGVGRLFTCRRGPVGLWWWFTAVGGWALWLGCLGCVGVVCELDSVFVCFVYACFLFLSVFGWDCWLAVFGWLVFLGFNVFVFVRRV